MIPELGHYALVLALALGLIQSVAPIVGAQTRDTALMRLASSTAVAQFVLIAFSFAALVLCYVTSDFSVATVFENSNSQMPFIYKVSSVWGNHEGSMLLWVLILSLFGALVALFGSNLPATLKANVLAVQSWIASTFYLFILLTSNPFLRLPQAPLEGRDLNPILQDPGLAMHPPLLYLGYVGFSIAFSFAIAALIEGHIDAAWARWVRPWTLMAWMCLTLGIAVRLVLGLLHARLGRFLVLGSGRKRFADAVARRHGAAAFRRGDGKAQRAQSLDHPARDPHLLAVADRHLPGALGRAHLGALLRQRSAARRFHPGHSGAVYRRRSDALCWRASTLKQGGLFAPISREGSLVFNNLFLTTACLTVLVGTLYPLALEAFTGAKISVGGPFFNLTFGPLFIALMMAMPFGPLLAWKRGDLLGVAQRLMAAFAVGLVAVAAAFAIKGGGSVLAPFGVGVAFYVMMGAVIDLVERTGLMRMPMATVFMRAAGLPRSTWGTAIAHFGIAASLLGIVGAAAWGSERIVSIRPSQTVALSGYELTFDGLFEQNGPNYNAQVAKFTVREGGIVIGIMEPQKRNFAVRETSTNEAALMTRGVGQLYLSLGDSNKDGSIAIRLYYKPLVMLIWLGAVVMMLGGGLSLSDRRLRVGAPKPAARPALQPAE